MKQKKLMGIAIIGAGGHGKVVLDCLRRQFGEDQGVKFFDDEPQKPEVMGVPVIGNVEEAIEDKKFKHVFVAIGDNRKRYEIAQLLLNAGKSLLTIVHPFTAISNSAKLGKGTIAIAGTVVNAEAKVGNGVILNTNCSVGHDCVVKDFAQIAPGVNIGGGAIIEEGAFLGIGSLVVPKLRIGEWSVIGAGSVVLKDVQPWTFCHGVPARTVSKLV